MKGDLYCLNEDEMRVTVDVANSVYMTWKFQWKTNNIFLYLPHLLFQIYAICAVFKHLKLLYNHVSCTKEGRHRVHHERKNRRVEKTRPVATRYLFHFATFAIVNNSWYKKGVSMWNVCSRRRITIDFIENVTLSIWLPSHSLCRNSSSHLAPYTRPPSLSCVFACMFEMCRFPSHYTNTCA